MQVDIAIRRYKDVVSRPNTDPTPPAVSQISYTQRPDTINLPSTSNANQNTNHSLAQNDIDSQQRTPHTFDQNFYHRVANIFWGSSYLADILGVI